MGFVIFGHVQKQVPPASFRCVLTGDAEEHGQALARQSLDDQGVAMACIALLLSAKRQVALAARRLQMPGLAQLQPHSLLLMSRS